MRRKDKKIMLFLYLALLLLPTVAAQTNWTGSILEQNYNLTRLMPSGNSTNESIIDDPPRWLASFNEEMNSIPVAVFLYLCGVILFLVIRRRIEVKDSEALLYSGFMTSLVGVLLFVVDTGITGVKLISWGALLPIIVITAVAIILNYINRNY